MSRPQIESLGWRDGEPAYRASCPACGSTGPVRTSQAQAKAALAEVHEETCTAAAVPLEPTK